MSGPAMSRHLRVLRASGLVKVDDTEEPVEQDARLRVYRLRPEPFVDLQAWLDQVQAFWSDQLEGSRRMSSVLRKEEIGFPMKSFSWDTACGRRLARHYLLEPVPKARLVDAVRTVGGIQAQILSAAELAIGVRVAEVTRQDVQAELCGRHSPVKP